jgi:hypothetical protein
MQAEFLAILLEPSAAPPSSIFSGFGASPERRMAVYRNNVRVAWVNALKDTYPVVVALVGDPFFHGMALAFARNYPPRSPVMAEYGGGFADFIPSFSRARTLPYLADMARLEWLRVQAFHAADTEVLAPLALAHLVHEPQQLAASRWKFHPSVGWLESRFAVVSLWLAHQHGDAAEVCHAVAQVPLAQAQAALVLRSQREVWVHGLSTAESLFIRALLNGETLAVAAETASHAPEPLDFTQTLALLLRQGALIAYESSGSQAV